MPKSAHFGPCHQRTGSHHDSPRGPSEEGALPAPSPIIDGALFPRRTRVGQQVPHAGHPPTRSAEAAPRVSLSRPTPPPTTPPSFASAPPNPYLGTGTGPPPGRPERGPRRWRSRHGRSWLVSRASRRNRRSRARPRRSIGAAPWLLRDPAVTSPPSRPRLQPTETRRNKGRSGSQWERGLPGDGQ